MLILFHLHMFRYSGKAKYILESVLLNENNLANACEGCDIDSIDDPHKEPSAHAGVKGSQRVTDSRFDWQCQPMFRRLPYDRFGQHSYTIFAYLNNFFYIYIHGFACESLGPQTLCNYALN